MVELVGALRVDKAKENLFEFAIGFFGADGCVNGVESCDETVDVAVYNRVRQSKCE